MCDRLLSPVSDSSGHAVCVVWYAQRLLSAVEYCVFLSVKCTTMYSGLGLLERTTGSGNFALQGKSGQPCIIYTRAFSHLSIRSWQAVLVRL